MALDAMLSRPLWVVALLDRLESSPVMVASLDAPRRQVLLTHPIAEVRRRAEKLLKTVARQDVTELVEKFRPALAMAGDGSRGREVFTTLCATCHKLGGVGQEVGPNLGMVRDKSGEALLLAVADPSAAVEDRYVQYAATTRDGRTFSGIVAEEGEAAVILRGADGHQETIRREDLAALVSTGLSLMPQGLLSTLDPGKFADLLAFIRASGAGPIEQAADGSVTLPGALATLTGPQIVHEEKYGTIGYWFDTQARAEWVFHVGRPGKFQVKLDYAAPPESHGNAAIVEVGPNRLNGRVSSTGGWDSYKERALWWRVELPAGDHHLTVRPDAGLKNALFDLRTVRLVPIKD
jgi:putative heme-binding domain-containing protein